MGKRVTIRSGRDKGRVTTDHDRNPGGQLLTGGGTTFRRTPEVLGTSVIPSHLQEVFFLRTIEVLLPKLGCLIPGPERSDVDEVCG